MEESTKYIYFVILYNVVFMLQPNATEHAIETVEEVDCRCLKTVRIYNCSFEGMYNLIAVKFKTVNCF